MWFLQPYCKWVMQQGHRSDIFGMQKRVKLLLFTCKHFEVKRQFRSCKRLCQDIYEGMVYDYTRQLMLGELSTCTVVTDKCKGESIRPETIYAVSVTQDTNKESPTYGKSCRLCMRYNHFTYYCTSEDPWDQTGSCWYNQFEEEYSESEEEDSPHYY